MRAIIIGGGIGGLTAAIALRRAGIEVGVFERASEPREVGAGISLWGNAIRALEMIGAADGVRAVGEQCLEAEIWNQQGRVLGKMPVAALDRAAGVPMVTLHRAQLLSSLLSHIPAELVRFGAECVGVDQNDGASRVRFADGSAAEGDVVIGADGIHSTVRAAVLGFEEPRYAGYTCYRAVVDFPDPRIRPGHVVEALGRGARCGIVRIGQGRIYWWAAYNAPAGGRDADARSRLAELYADWAAPIPEVIRATQPDRIIHNDIIDRVPSRPWGKGRVILIGDAAHPTTPNLGQGGCTAIEDGIVLARWLKACAEGKGSIDAALRGFEAERWPRTTLINKRSWMFGAVGHTTNRALCWARNTAFSLTPASLTPRLARSIITFNG